MIPIKNIYYMLSYAFKRLQGKEYKKIELEEFENINELFAEILILGLNKQLKQGLIRNYIDKTSLTSSPKGKINITESIKPNNLMTKRVECKFDEFSENNKLNQILKTTLEILVNEDIKQEQKRRIKKILPYFINIKTLNSKKINWQIRYDRNNQDYQMLIGISYLTIHNLLQREEKGTNKLKEFIDESRMSSLYEAFVLEYYKKEHKELIAHAPHINWQLDTDENTLLPIMKTDITLSKGNEILIIDTKYYKHITQEYYNTPKINSSNLYQIFTYVKNKEAELKDTNHKVSGLLLYAKTDKDKEINVKYSMSGNIIGVKTLDLNKDFEFIKKELDSIVEKYF